MDKKKDYLTIPEAATICSVSRTTMWRWVKEGYIKTCMTLGGQHRIRKAELDAVLTENEAYRVSGADLALTAQSSAHADSHPPKVLIVDDDPQVVNMITKLLTTQGYETATASDGFEAGVKVVQFNPDLVVLDLVMPGMDGFEVCKRIKENPGTSHIKVLTVSGHDTEENREKIFKAGADGFMPKPIDVKTILNEVKRLCRVSQLQPQKARAAG